MMRKKMAEAYKVEIFIAGDLEKNRRSMCRVLRNRLLRNGNTNAICLQRRV